MTSSMRQGERTDLTADSGKVSLDDTADLLGVSNGTVQRRAPGPRRAYAIAEWMQPKLGVSVLTSATNKLTARHAANGIVLWHKEVPRGDRLAAILPFDHDERTLSHALNFT
jgi:hypothetical protein